MSIHLPIPNGNEPGEIQRTFRTWAAALTKGIADAAASGPASSTAGLTVVTPNPVGDPVSEDLTDYLLPPEKVFYKNRWDVVQAEEPTVVSQAATASISSTAYVAAFTALSNYLTDQPASLYTYGGKTWPVAGWNTLDTIKKYLGPSGKKNWMAVWAAYDAALNNIKAGILQAAALPTETFRPKFLWDFGPSDPSAFLPVGFSTSSVAAPDDQTARRWGSLGSGNLGQFTGFQIAGRDAYIMLARVRLVSGTWLGRGYYSTDGTTWSSYETITAPQVGVWVILAWDLRSMTSGTSITGQSIIKGFALELGQASGNVDVDWVAVGTYGAGSRADYDLALQDSITDLLGRADTTVFGNTVITNSTNMFPNPYSEATTAPGSFGALNVSSSAAHTGVNGRRTLLGDHGVACTPVYSVTAGDGYYLAFWLRATGGSGSGGLQALFKDASGSTVTSPSFGSFQSSSTSWVYLADQFLVPAGAVSMQFQWYNNTTGGRIIDMDAFVLRKSADAWLLVNGAVEAYFARFGGMQSNSLAVGPFLQFRATSGGLKLQGRPDGSMSRVTAADRVTYPTLNAENASDAEVYMDDSRIYPSGVANTYEAMFGGTTDDRGIILNMGSAFATSGLQGLLVKYSGTTIGVYGCTGIGTYGAALKTVTVATASVQDKLSAIYYPALQKDSTGAATIRMRVLLDGVSVMTLSDTDLTASFNGARGGYAGVKLQANCRIWNPQFGKGFVTIQDGAVRADTFEGDLAILGVVRSPNYIAGSAGNAPLGFYLSGAAFSTVYFDGTSGTCQFELGSSANFGGYQVAVITNRVMGNSTTWSSPGTYTWTAPTGITSVELTLQAVGGAGYAGYGQGGQGGQYIRQKVTVVPGTTYTIVLGAAGANSTMTGSGFTTVTATFGGDGGAVLTGGANGADRPTPTETPESGWSVLGANGGDGSAANSGITAGRGGSVGAMVGGNGPTPTATKAAGGGGGASAMAPGGNGALTPSNGAAGTLGSGGGSGNAGGAGGPAFGRIRY